MPSLASGDWYTEGAFQIGTGATVFTSATIIAILVKSGYAFNPDHQFVSALTEEVSGGGYARITLAGKTATRIAGEGLRFDCADFTYSNLTATGIAAVIYARSTGSDATSPLLWRTRLPAPVNRSGSDLPIIVPSNGLALFAAV